MWSNLPSILKCLHQLFSDRCLSNNENSRVLRSRKRAVVIHWAGTMVLLREMNAVLASLASMRISGRYGSGTEHPYCRQKRLAIINEKARFLDLLHPREMRLRSHGRLKPTIKYPPRRAGQKTFPINADKDASTSSFSFGGKDFISTSGRAPFIKVPIAFSSVFSSCSPQTIPSRSHKY